MTKNVYDGAGRLVHTYTTDAAAVETNGYNPVLSWAEADSVDNDIVLEQTDYTYDADGNVILTATRERFDNDSNFTLGAQEMRLRLTPGFSVDNNSFETPSLPSDTASANTTAGTWIFNGNSGIASNGDSYTNGVNAEDGSQMAYLGDTGSFSQAMTESAGTYKVTFWAAAGSNSDTSSGSESIAVYMDIGTSQQFITMITPGATFADYSATFMMPSTDTGTLTFQGVGASGQYALVDLVGVTSAPSARVSYMLSDYDGAGRQTESLNIGTNAGVYSGTTSGFGATLTLNASGFLIPSATSTNSAYALITQTQYNAAGYADMITDPNGIVDLTSYDAAGPGRPRPSPITTARSTAVRPAALTPTSMKPLITHTTATTTSPAKRLPCLRTPRSPSTSTTSPLRALVIHTSFPMIFCGRSNTRTRPRARPAPSADTP